MTQHVTSDGIRLNVEVTGSNNAPTVVLAHGLAGSVALQWRATGVIDRLTAAGLRVVAFDFVGHGQSDAPAAGERYRDVVLARDLAEVFDVYASPDAVLVGYSMGAAIALLALEHGLTARGAVLGAAAPAVLGWRDEDHAASAAAVAALRSESEPDAVMKPWLAFLDMVGADRVALAHVLVGLRPVVADWSAITAPAVVVAGDNDVMAAPPASIVARLPHARAVVLPGDHISVPATAAFSDLVVEVARTDQ